MPLAFESTSHGTVAFGFFNIESDMLLLDRYFFFADGFCARIGDLAGARDDHAGTAAPWKVWLIETAAGIGDLMGAIHGIRFTGFIGDVYRRFPFPRRAEDFKQNPKGVATQAEMGELIKPYAVETVIEVTPDANGSSIAVGDYRFERLEFQRLLDYVWLGGYPRWRGGIRPGYVEAMRLRVTASSAFVFKDARFSHC